MADAQYYGRIRNGSAPGTSRSIQKSDTTTLEIEVVGKYGNLESLVVSKGPGDDAAFLVNSSEGDSFAGYRIKTVGCQREDGGVGVLRASLVKASSITEPYHITYTVDMQEVQKNLISHPLFQKHPDALKEITLWNETAVGSRVVWGNTRDADTFKYLDTSYSASGSSLVDVTNQYAIKYCKAVTAGIETFTLYLPVVSKVSLYLKEPPGLSQNDTTHKLSGTLRYSTHIGRWDDGFDFQIQGYTTTDKAGWFKSKDRYSQNADGTWQREEEWVYTNDKTHAWIYEEAT